MHIPDLDLQIRSLRRMPILAPTVPLPAVETLIPHRPPALRVSSLTGFDAAARTLTAVWVCDPADPAFDGHFPDVPILPATVQTEAMAQTGACLLALHQGKPCQQVRLMRFHRAEFLRAISPGETLTLTAGLLEINSLLAVFSAQVIVDGRICAIAILEAHLYD